MQKISNFVFLFRTMVLFGNTMEGKMIPLRVIEVKDSPPEVADDSIFVTAKTL